MKKNLLWKEIFFTSIYRTDANHDPATGLEPEGHATVDSSRANAAFVRGFREGRQDWLSLSPEAGGI